MQFKGRMYSLSGFLHINTIKNQLTKKNWYCLTHLMLHQSRITVDLTDKFKPLTYSCYSKDLVFEKFINNSIRIGAIWGVIYIYMSIIESHMLTCRSCLSFLLLGGLCLVAINILHNLFNNAG